MSKIIVTHLVKLKPTAEQAEMFNQACGVARFTYNWALAQKKAEYKLYVAQGKPKDFPWMSIGDLRKKFNSIKKADFPWACDPPRSVPSEAINNLGKAFTNFFEKRAKYPKFKKKRSSKPSFYAEDGILRVNGKSLRLPKFGEVKMFEELRIAALQKEVEQQIADGTKSEKDRVTYRIYAVTVSRIAGEWFASIQVKASQLILRERNQRTEKQGRVGVDLGIKTLATLSKPAKELPAPKALDMNLDRLRRLNRSLSRKKKGSSNSAKARIKLAKLHHRISNIRKDALHKLTYHLVTNFNSIVIEDLNVKGMVKNKRLARHLHNRGFGEFRRQLNYKAEWRGVEVIVADRFFASSKTCSCCGVKNDALTLAVRSWECTACGASHDRDMNAAINLERYIPVANGVQTVESSALAAA